MTKIFKILSLGLVFFGFSNSTLLADPLNNNPIIPNINNNAPKIDVCFVLDTTGSMGGMIESAKQKIWYIANQIVSANNRPDVRFCVIGYRDRGDRYVTDYHPLTRDIDSIYKTLSSYKAQGGGDSPESVNQALYEAVTKPDWRQSNNALKIIYLVGDAPPHMNYANDVPYFKSVKLASQKGVFINTIQCGNDLATRRIWNQIASTANGDFSMIAQNAATTIIKTPWDQKLQTPNKKLGNTIVPYGVKSKRIVVYGHQKISEFSMNDSSRAERLAYNSKTGRVVQGDKDLLELIAEGKANLNSIRKNYLPTKLQSKSKHELKLYIELQQKNRKKISQKVKIMIKLRDSYLAKKSKLVVNEFDQKIVKSLKRQAKERGISY